MERCRAAGVAKFAVMCRLKFVRLWTKAVIEVSILRASGIEEARPAGSHSGGPTFFLQARSRRDRAAGPKAGNGEKARRKELGEGAGDKSWPNDSWGSWQRGRGAAGDAPQATACCRMLPQAQEDPCRKAGAGSRQEAARTQEAFRASLATRLTAFWQKLPPWTRGALYTKRKALATNFLQVDNFLFEPISGTGRCLPSPRSPWPPATIWRSQHAALQQA